MKAFLLIFDSDYSADRQPILDVLDKIPEVTFWYTCFPHCIFFTSRLRAQELHDRLEKLVTKKANARYLIIEAGADRQGLLPKQGWHLFNHPSNPRLRDDPK